MLCLGQPHFKMLVKVSVLAVAFYSQFFFSPRAQQVSICKEKDKEEKHRIKVLRHADGVRQQVREREMQAIALRREVYKEGDRLDEEARHRRIRLDEIKEKKLRELK